MTQLTVIGNLASDPELKFTPQGKAVCQFVVISSKSRKNESGEWESSDVTSWYVNVWDALAENTAESLSKGSPVIVYGTAVWKSWESKDTAEKRGRLEITAIDVAHSLKRGTVKASASKRPIADPF